MYATRTKHWNPTGCEGVILFCEPLAPRWVRYRWYENHSMCICLVMLSFVHPCVALKLERCV